MEQFILQLGTMSLQATVVLGIVFVFRMIFQKAGVSKKYTCLLWLLPYLCMICPWKLEGDFGFWRQVEFQTQQSAEGMEAWDSEVPATVTESITGVPGVTIGQNGSTASGTNGQITMSTDGMSDVLEQNDMLSGQDGIGQKGQELTGSVWYQAIGLHSGSILWTAAYILWIIGLLVLLIYSADAHLKLHTKLICCLKLSDNIYLADDINVPFVMGIWKPRIYLPTGMAMESLEYVIAHERTHIKRRDPLKKTVAFLITCIHWFNPFAWIAFRFFGKDMEMACDEETVLVLGMEHKKDYAAVLLQISSGSRMFVGAPLAFGEGSVKARIMNIVSYEKTWRVVSAFAVFIVLILAAIFMTRESAYITMEKVDERMKVPTVEQDIYLTMDGQTAQLADEDYFLEITDFLRSMKISRKEESLSRAEDRPADVTVRIGWDVYKFTADCSSVWLDDGVKPSFSYKVKKPEQVKVFWEALMAEWQMAGGRNVADVSFAGESYFTCILPEGTWQNYSHSLDMNDIYSGFLIMGDYEEPAHGTNVPEAWYALGGVGVGMTRKKSVEGSPVMKYEDGALVSVGWFSNHSSISKVIFLSTLPAPFRRVPGLVSLSLI